MSSLLSVLLSIPCICSHCAILEGSLHDLFGGFDGFGGSGEHLLLLVLQNTVPRDDRDGFGGFKSPQRGPAARGPAS